MEKMLKFVLLFWFVKRGWGTLRRIDLCPLQTAVYSYERGVRFEFANSKIHVLSLTLFNKNLKFGGTPMSKNDSEMAYIVIYCS
jgi:hypothetical protein